MMRLGIAIAVLAMLGGCASLTDENRAFIRDRAIERIERFNALGVDPVQLNTVELLALDTACLSADLLTTVTSSAPRELTPQLRDFCELVIKAAAPAN
jgi:hypothetical protein